MKKEISEYKEYTKKLEKENIQLDTQKSKVESHADHL